MRGQVQDQVKKARSDRLLALNDQDARAFRSHFLGTTMTVLIEGRKHGHWEGLTDNYLRVELAEMPGDLDNDWSNTLVTAQLENLVEDGILGTLINHSANGAVAVITRRRMHSLPTVDSLSFGAGSVTPAKE
jgi:threonylcarbamoyladenosine tRNA methylthiotransferase MtaB